MKKLIILALLCAPMWGAGALVGTPVGYGSADPVSVSYTVQTTGNLIVTCLRSTSGNAVTPSASGYSFTAVFALYDDGNQATRCYTTVAGTPGATTFSGTSSNGNAIYIAVAEFSGLQTTSMIDGTPASAFGTSTSWSSGSYTTSSTSTLMSWGCSYQEASSYSPGSGWSLATGTTPAKCMIQYYPAQAAGSKTATGTTGDTQIWAITGFAIKEAVASGRRRVVLIQ